MDPSAKDSEGHQELKQLRKRLVQMERAHRELVATRQQEVQQHRQQLLQAEKTVKEAQTAAQQLDSENQRLRIRLGANGR